MSVTTTLLNNALCNDVASVIISFLTPKYRSDYMMAKIGFYEKCMTIDPNIAFNGACEGGHENIVRLMINKGVDEIDEGFISVCKIGRLDLVEYLMNVSNYYPSFSPKKGLYSACNNGHVKIVEYLCNFIQNSRDLMHCIDEACRNCHFNIVKFIVNKGVPVTGRNQGFTDVCKNGRLDIVEYLVSRGLIFVQEGFYSACDYGHIDIIKYLCDKMLVLNYVAVGGFNTACKSAQFDIVKYLYKRYNGSLNMFWGFCFSCMSGNINIVNFFIEKGCDMWNEGLQYSCTDNKVNICKLMIKKGATNINAGLSFACKYDSSDCVDVLIENGATYCKNCDNLQHQI